MISRSASGIDRSVRPRGDAVRRDRIVQAPGTPGISVRADLGPTPRVKSGELDRAPPSGNPLWAIPIKDLSETRDRPIFTPSRRPPPPPVVEKPYTPPPPPPRVEASRLRSR